MCSSDQNVLFVCRLSSNGSVQLIQYKMWFGVNDNLMYWYIFDNIVISLIFHLFDDVIGFANVMRTQLKVVMANCCQLCMTLVSSCNDTGYIQFVLSDNTTNNSHDFCRNTHLCYNGRRSSGVFFTQYL